MQDYLEDCGGEHSGFDWKDHEDRLHAAILLELRRLHPTRRPAKKGPRS